MGEEAPTSSSGWIHNNNGGAGDPVAMELEAYMQALSPLPRQAKQLLGALERLEKFLLGLDQSPSDSTQRVLGSLMKALTSKDLVNHHNVDVKVCVASCLSAVLRITAPDAPFGDEELKESFRLMVSAFANISDMSSYSFDRRVTILKTVSHVRSCLVMLDLNCDALIMDMFNYFLSNIREYHPDVVFSSMGMIMILVLKEMSEVPMELLFIFLDHVRTENQGILPVARRLVERVIEICAWALAPHMPQAVQYRGFPLSDYSAIISHVCDQSLLTGESRKSQKFVERPSSLQSSKYSEIEHIDECSSEDPSHVDPSQNKCLMLTMTAGNLLEENHNQLHCSPSCTGKEIVCGIRMGDSPRRNRTEGKIKACMDLSDDQMLSDTNLIGLNIKVWRPKYCRFQNAVIYSYDLVMKKHKILYANGDREMLVLKEHRWNFGNDETTPPEDK